MKLKKIFRSKKKNRRYGLSGPNNRSFGISKVVSVIFVLIFGFLILSYYFLFHSNIFAVSEIDVSGVDGVESVNIYNVLTNKIVGKNIFKVNSKLIQSVVNENIPEYELNDTKRIIPNKIYLKLSPRFSKYVISAQNGVFNVDESLFVYGFAESNDAKVYYYKDLKMGSKIDDDILKGALIYSLTENRVMVNESEIFVFLPNGGKVTLPEEMSDQVALETSKMLQKILQKYTIEGRSIESIDMRFSKPVVNFK